MSILEKINQLFKIQLFKVQHCIQDYNFWIFILVLAIFQFIIIQCSKNQWLSFFVILILGISLFIFFDFKKYKINYKAFLLVSLIMFIAGPIGEHILFKNR